MSKNKPSLAQLKKQLDYFERLVSRLEFIAREIGKGNTLPALQLAKDSIDKNRNFAEGIRRQIAELERTQAPAGQQGSNRSGSS